MEQVDWQKIGAVICFLIAWLTFCGMIIVTILRMKKTGWKCGWLYDCKSACVGVHLDHEKRCISVLIFPCFGFWMQWPGWSYTTPVRFCFWIENHGEIAAGLRPYTEEVHISVLSGDPGGDSGQFEAFMRDSLADWFDGASVEILDVNGKTEETDS